MKRWHAQSRARALLAVVLPLVFAAVVAGTAPLHALELNGFLPAAGHGDVALSYTAESYDRFWVGTRKVADPGVGQVDIDSLSLWLQWGLTDRLALVANLPYVDASSNGLGGFAESGVQDLSALLKLRLLASGRHALVGAFGVRTPARSYEANLPVDLGDGTTDALLRLVYQYQVGGFYLSQQVGYDVRNKDAPDDFALYTEAGFTVGRITCGGTYSRLIADSSGTDIGDPGFTFPSNREEFTRIGAKFFGRISERLGVSVLYVKTLDGRNTGDTSGFSGGAVVRF